MGKQNNGLAVKQGQVVTVRRAAPDVLDLYRDKMTTVVVSAGGRDTGPTEAAAHRKTRSETIEHEKKRIKVSRVVDTLGQMKARGDINDAMYQAGIKFQLGFDVGQWESMPISRYDGMPRSGKGGDISLQIFNARTRILDAVERLGGFESPCGIAVWYAIGMRYSINQLAKDQKKETRDEWKGALKGALQILAVHYNFAHPEKRS